MSVTAGESELSMHSLKRSLRQAEEQDKQYDDTDNTEDEINPAKRHTTFKRPEVPLRYEEEFGDDISEPDFDPEMVVGDEDESDMDNPREPITDDQDIFTPKVHAFLKELREDEERLGNRFIDEEQEDTKVNAFVEAQDDDDDMPMEMDVEGKPAKYRESALELDWSSDDAIMPYESEQDVQQEVWLPNMGIEQIDDIDYDQSSYSVFHRFNTEWPCLSFDLLHDSLGTLRTRVPHTMYLVCGTQAQESNVVLDKDASNDTQMSDKNASAFKHRKNENAILVMKLSQLQKTKYDDDMEDDNEEKDKDYIHITDDDPILQSREILHPSTVNRIRSAGIKHPYVIASWGEDCCVRIFNAKQHLKSIDGMADDLNAVKKNVKPVFSLQNADEGYGMAWSIVDEGRLLTGSCVGELHLIVPADQGGSSFKRHTKFKTPKASIEDIAWSPVQSTIFATAGVDKTLRIWDTRDRKNCTRLVKNAHNDDINVISWNTQHAHLLVSGSDDRSFRVWDMRKFPKASQRKGLRPYADYQWHTKAITSVCWHPQDASSLVVSSEDHQVSLWDLSLESDDTEAPQGAKLPAGTKLPPQLVFVHGQKNVKEICFHKQIPNMVVATGESGFHVFQPDNLEEAFSRMSLQ